MSKMHIKSAGTNQLQSIVPAGVSFEISDSDLELVTDIVARYRSLMLDKNGHDIHVADHEMDLIATHANGCPLDFERMLAADDWTLCHDIHGIERHLDRETGKLMNHFLPRLARKADDVVTAAEGGAS